MPHRHVLPACRDTIHYGFFDAALEPVLRIKSGDTVTLDTLSGDRIHLPTDASMTPLDDHLAVLDDMPEGGGPHYMTGPIHVEGAEPGDSLKVEILEVKLRQDWGWNYIGPLFGTLQEDFGEPHLMHMAIDVERGVVTMPWGLEIPASPFFGVMGTAPPAVWGRQPSIIPRAFGGNIDNKELLAGTVLYLPVFNSGALFSVGDGHARQGNGEVSGTPVETALSGTFRLSVEKNTGIGMPWAETPTHYMTMGIHEDMDVAARQALREMIALIRARTELTAAEAYALCSIIADLEVTQTVDVNKGIHAMLPRYAIGG